jgi:hypothetical protein
MIEKDFTNETLGNVVKEIDSLSEPTETFVTGLSTDMDEKYSELEAEVTSTINKNLNETFTPRNRAERRAWEKELKKKDKNKRVFADNLRQAAERLAYTEMIQRVRKMNEEIEKEGAQENEAAN